MMNTEEKCTAVLDNMAKCLHRIIDGEVDPDRGLVMDELKSYVAFQGEVMTEVAPLVTLSGIYAAISAIHGAEFLGVTMAVMDDEHAYIADVMSQFFAEILDHAIE